MYTRKVSSEELYTIEEVRKIIENEKRESKQRILASIGYKLLGLLCAVLCVVTPMLLDGDATACFVLLPASIYFLLGKVE